jgi:hypothetical protein
MRHRLSATLPGSAQSRNDCAQSQKIRRLSIKNSRNGCVAVVGRCDFTTWTQVFSLNKASLQGEYLP